MLPDLAVPASLLAVLENLRVFTTPTFATFTALVTGLVAQTGKGTVAGMLTGAGLARTWSHDWAQPLPLRIRIRQIAALIPPHAHTASRSSVSHMIGPDISQSWSHSGDRGTETYCGAINV